MKRSKLLFLLLAFLAIFLLVSLSLTDGSYKIVDQVIVIETSFNAPFKNIIIDNSDIGIYFQRTSWLPEGTIPYRDVLQEYPQWGLAYLSLPRLLTNNYLYYRTGLFVLNAFCYVFTGLLLFGLLEKYGKVKNIFYLFLPSFLYFSFNRFDIFVTLFVLLSLHLFLKGKFSWSFFVLGVATFAKWYPLVLLPIYIFYIIKTRSVDVKILFRLSVCYSLPIILPAITTIFYAGWSGFLYPYLFHISREAEPFSLLYWLGLPSIFSVLFFLMQFSGVAVSLFYIKPEKPRDLLLSALISLLAFIFFNKFYSPQFIVWFLSFFLFFLDKRLAWVLVFYDLSNYFGWVKAIPALWQDFSLSIYFNLFRTILFVVVLIIISKQIISAKKLSLAVN